MTLLNPMGITNPNPSAPVQQPDYRVPTVPVNVGTVGTAIVGSDTLALGYTTPPAKFKQAGIGPNSPF